MPGGGGNPDTSSPFSTTLDVPLPGPMISYAGACVPWPMEYTLMCTKSAGPDPPAVFIAAYS